MILIDPDINIVNLFNALRGQYLRESPYSIFFCVVKQKNPVSVLRGQIDVVGDKDDRQMLLVAKLMKQQKKLLLMF